MAAASVLQVSGECRAVAEGEKEEEAVLTLTRAVEVYNIRDGRCVRSWSLGSSGRITCGAVFHAAMEVYCAVRNETELLLWRSEDKTLPAVKPSLPYPPFSLLTPSHPHHFVIVDPFGVVAVVALECGDVRVVCEIVLGGRRLRNKRLHVVSAVMSEVGQSESVVVICGDGEVFVCAVDQSDLTITHSLTVGSKVSCWSLCVCGDSLLLPGKDGTISAHLLTPSHSPPHSLTAAQGHTHCKLTSVSPDLFAVTGSGGVVSLRDALYGTILASFECDLGSIEMVWSVCGCLVMCGGEGMRVCQLPPVGGASIATVLGRNTTPLTISAPLQWAEPGKIKGHRRSEVGSSEELVRLGKLCDPHKPLTLGLLAKLFPPSLSLPPSSYWPLVQRLVREKQFWPHSQLAQLLKAGAVGASDVEMLVERAMEQEDWALVVQTLSHAQNIPETSLVTLIQHTLDLPEVVESYGEELTRESILWQLLALPFSDSLLQSPLSRWPLPSVLSLLQLLTPHISVASLSRPPPLPYSRLLDWLAVLLDTHWTSLTLSPSARPLLHNYRHTTYHQMLVCENLSTVQTLLQAQKTPLHQSPQEKLFTVERLKLKI